MMLSNCGSGEDSWEFPGLQGDQISQSWRKSTLNIYWKGWCWSWSSSTLATWGEEPTHWKRPLPIPFYQIKICISQDSKVIPMWEALVSSHVLSKFHVLIEPGMNKKGSLIKMLILPGQNMNWGHVNQSLKFKLPKPTHRTLERLCDGFVV